MSNHHLEISILDVSQIGHKLAVQIKHLHKFLILEKFIVNFIDACTTIKKGQNIHYSWHLLPPLCVKFFALSLFSLTIDFLNSQHMLEVGNLFNLKLQQFLTVFDIF